MKLNCIICKNDCSDCNYFECKELKEDLVLIKKKVSSHYVPPDMTALKLLCDSEIGNYSELSDEELELARKELLLEISKLDLN